MPGLTNKQLTTAKKAKKDEFYTTRKVIEDELIHYKHDFTGRPVLCNCNDWPERSEFVRFFMRHMHDWNIPRLIAVGYREDAGTLLGNGTGVKYELRNDGRDTEYTLEDFTITPLAGTGGFETPECEQLLDIPNVIVCTNPPFGRFRQYLPLLAEHDVGFLIIGNLNAVTYKEIFPLFKTERCWLGVSIHSGDRPFNVPDDYPLEAANHGYDENGRPYIRVNTVRWFTNLSGGLSDKNRPATTGSHYAGHEQDYPEYDDYPAINVDRLSDIPDDYMGEMGVPVTILDHWGPSRLADGNGFRLLGVLNHGKDGDWDKALPQVNGVIKFKRLLIQRVDTTTV